jgi:hypothetical protein
MNIQWKFEIISTIMYGRFFTTEHKEPDNLYQK